jgi:Ca-activated chloride channel family protein
MNSAMRRPAIVALFATLLRPLPASAQDAAAPSFRTASEIVVLPATVVDRDGAYISGLPLERFTVRDNGRPQEVSFFSNADTPVSVAMVIDNSGSMRGKLGHFIAAVHAFARASNPEDDLLAIEFNDRVRDAMDGRTIRASDAAALDAALRTLAPSGRTALYDAILAGLERLEHAAHARKALIVLSDGGDNASRSTTLDHVLLRAAESNTTIYTIGLFEQGAPDTNPGVLNRLAKATGGERFLPSSPAVLLKACERIARAIRSGYLLGYTPPARDGLFHRIQIRVDDADGRKLEVRTRPGYMAPR